jgi:hypothetical protein
MSSKKIALTDKFELCAKYWPEEIQDRVIFEIMAQQLFGKSSFNRYGDWAERGLNSDSNQLFMDHLIGQGCLQLSIESKGTNYVTYIAERLDFIVIFQCFTCKPSEIKALHIDESRTLLKNCEQDLTSLI